MASKRSAKRCPTHPGALLREDILPSVGKSKTEIARLLGISRETLYRLLREEQSVTAELAARLGKLFGNGPGLWLRMQAAHDEWRAQRMDMSAIPTIDAAA
jgi:addiction module HigA family antidote